MTLKIYLSATFADLEQHRERIATAVGALGAAHFTQVTYPDSFAITAVPSDKKAIRRGTPPT